MPVDYSKWVSKVAWLTTTGKTRPLAYPKGSAECSHASEPQDALELSDDSDIEVHPNVDKRSFIRAKQHQIHQQRQQNKQQIETLKYERIVNDALLKRISALLDALKAHADQAGVGPGQRNPAEVAFQAVMQSAAALDPKDDQPPPRPAGVHGAEEPLPTYTKMMATLLDQVNKALDEKKVGSEERYGAVVAEVEEHLKKVTDLQSELLAKLDELEREESRKITSESIHAGFDSSHINKSTSGPPPSAAGAARGGKQGSSMELLNPNYQLDSSGALKAAPVTAARAGDNEDDDEDGELSASALARQFAAVKSTDYRASLQFLGAHPEILVEKETDGLLVLAFDAQLDGRDDVARNCVHQALLIQYCRALGRDGVALFFKRIMTPGHQAQGVFHKDVQETYARIRTRAREINAQRAKDKAEGKNTEEVEQIQLQAVEPGTVINIQIPVADSQDPAEQEARAIFNGFKPAMKKALETGNLDEVNKVLGKMDVGEAEELVNQLSAVSAS